MVQSKMVNKTFVFFLYLCFSVFLYSSSIYNGLSNKKELDLYTSKIVNYDDYERRGEFVYEINDNITYTGRVIQKYPNGQISVIFEYLNGRKTGAQYQYYDTGQLKTKILFNNDKENGYQYGYYKNGTLNYSLTFIDGKKNGNFIDYYPNKKIKSQREYKNDVMTTLIKYTENGQTITYTYKNIKDDMGEVTTYHKNGQIKSKLVAYIENYTENEENRFKFLYDGLGKYYDEKGNLAGEMVLDKNKTYGNEMKLYYPNGNVQYYAIMGDSVKEYIDKIIEYYDNGQIKQDCTETSGSWSCLTYSKDGTYKGIAQGKPKTYSNLWVNIGLAFLNVLF